MAAIRDDLLYTRSFRMELNVSEVENAILNREASILPDSEKQFGRFGRETERDGAGNKL